MLLVLDGVVYSRFVCRELLRFALMFSPRCALKCRCSCQLVLCCWPLQPVDHDLFHSHRVVLYWVRRPSVIVRLVRHSPPPFSQREERYTRGLGGRQAVLS